MGQSTNADGSHQAAVSAARAAEALQSIASKLDRTEVSLTLSTDVSYYASDYNGCGLG